MAWLYVARGMAQGMILAGSIGAVVLAANGKDPALLVLNAIVGLVMLPLIEREIRR